jgi:hypothetical protein
MQDLETDGGFEEQVGSLPLEQRVGLLGQHKHHVGRHLPRPLVAQPLEGHPRPRLPSRLMPCQKQMTDGGHLP